MKRNIKYLLLIPAIIFCSWEANAQFTTIKPNNQLKNTNIKNVPQIKKPAVVLDNRISVDNAQNLKSTVDLKTLPIITLSPEELERNRTKTWEVNIRKPNDGHFEIIHGGTYTKEGFKMTPRPTGERTSKNQTIYYQSNSILVSNLVKDRDYRLTIVVDPKYFPNATNFIVGLGTKTVSIAWVNGQKEYHIDFTSAFAGQNVLHIGPAYLQGDPFKPDTYTVLAYKLSELAEIR
ncbi:hypothetical protein ACFSKL_00690 [Belliella marina]|uniref:Rhamnogalacturonan lyase domain-containing protein n=1 Tax=Belliella marina TaxID=1644146 RepID=A0ABW4VIC9_9BACT